MEQPPTIARINAEWWVDFERLAGWPERITFLLDHQSINMAVPVSMPLQFMLDLIEHLRPERNG